MFILYFNQIFPKTMIKKNIKIFFFFCIVVLTIISYLNFLNKKKETKEIDKNIKIEVEDLQSSNLLSELNFVSEDDRNIYKLEALEGEIDFENNNIIFFKKIKALIELEN